MKKLTSVCISIMAKLHEGSGGCDNQFEVMGGGMADGCGHQYDDLPLLLYLPYIYFKI